MSHLTLIVSNETVEPVLDIDRAAARGLVLVTDGPRRPGLREDLALGRGLVGRLRGPRLRRRTPAAPDRTRPVRVLYAAPAERTAQLTLVG